MSGGFSAATRSSILSGAVPQSRIDDAVMRILTQLFAVGVFDRTDYGTPGNDVRSKEHDALNTKFAVASTYEPHLSRRRASLEQFALPGYGSIDGAACAQCTAQERRWDSAALGRQKGQAWDCGRRKQCKRWRKWFSVVDTYCLTYRGNHCAPQERSS